ncbi:MAG: lactate racemase domain-containing protein [Myxococcota bacterium]
MPLHDLEQLVVTIDKDSAPRIFHYGEDFLLEDLPPGTRVIYPPPPMKGLENVDAAIRYAINHPHGKPPLHALLEPGMKVTIAIDDISLPLPPMKTPDARQRMLEIVLQTLADYGVDDVHLIIALGVHRRMTDAEIKRCVGSKIFNAYHPDRLYNHDAEDPEGITELGTTDDGYYVALNRRVVESDLLIYLNVNFVPMNGGHKSVGVGLCDYRTLRNHHNPSVLRKTESYMAPSRSHMHDIYRSIGDFINEHLNVFHIETVLNNRMYDDTLDFLSRNEDHFSDLDWLKFDGLRLTLKNLPRGAKNKVMMKIPAPYDVIAVNAGATDPVHKRTLETSFSQYSVSVKGQCDIWITGVPYISPYNVNSLLNPLLVQVMALGYFFNLNRGTPLLRKGGTIILTHPCFDDFDPDHHPSYIEFFNRLLPETTDALTLHKKYEREFAENPSYIDRFRFGNAYHGSHPFFMWYWGERGRQWANRVIVAGAENARVPELMGWEHAASLSEAIAMAQANFDGSPEIAVTHIAPTFLCDVTP